MLLRRNILQPGPIGNTGYPLEVKRTAVTVDEAKDTVQDSRSKQTKKGNKMKQSKQAETEADAKVEITCAEDVDCKKLSRLEEHIRIQITNLAPTQTSYARTNRCLQQLQAIVQLLGPAWVVVPFGSTANGFGTVHSDLDATCCLPGQVLDGDIQEQAAWVLRERIVPMLMHNRQFLVKEQILNARIPIVKLRFEGSLDVDLSCHNPQPLLNTRLLRAYSRMDWKIKQLGLAIKLWAKGSQVCDASKAHLSSYTFTLLMLYFLQVHPQVMLPVLPVEAFQDYANKEADLRVRSAITNWVCPLSVPELLVRFFEFYSNHELKGFDWGAEVASVRTGLRGKASEPIYLQLRGRYASRLHVEDPYQIERNLHCVLGKEEELQLRAAFIDAFTDIMNGETPKGLRGGLSESYLAASSPPIYEPMSKGHNLMIARGSSKATYPMQIAASNHPRDKLAASTRSECTTQFLGSDEDTCAATSRSSSETDIHPIWY